jgi:hypothetical protein
MWEINIWSVLVSAVAAMVIGSIWYGPLFGKKFMEASGMNKWTPEQQAAMKKKMMVSYAAQFAASFVMFYTVAGIIIGFSDNTALGGMVAAFLVWLGIIVPVKIGDLVWGGSKTMFWLVVGNMLFTLLAVGAIVGAWT